jgi:outer membrane protein assembly factor BamA
LKLRRIAVVLTFLLPFQTVTPVFAKSKGASGTVEQPVISRITIRNTDIFDFDTNPALRRFPYNTINLLHIQTKEQIIARELLFKVGDKLDSYLIQETERNLRALSFIRAARIVKFPQPDGTVALVVHVNDAWTTEPQINLGGQNKISSTEVGFKEKNLFGYGKTADIFYERGDNYIQRQYNYIDPRLFGSRWQLNTNFLNRTDAEERDIQLERPFFSADTRYSMRGSSTWRQEELDEFQNNTKVSRFQQTKTTNEAYIGTKVGAGRDVVSHIGPRFQNSEWTYSRNADTAPNIPIPEKNSANTLFLDFDTARSHFEEMTHLEKMSRVEDISMGPALKLSPGISTEIFYKGGEVGQAQASYEQWAQVGNPDRLFYNKYTYSGRNPFGGDSENQRYLINWKYYDRTSDRHTLVLNTRADWGDKLDPDNQVELGPDNGLRAFRVDDISGNNGWVFNAEDRFFFIDELWNLFAVGAAVFYDTGYVWAEHDPVALSKLRSDVGAGLRFGLTRSSNEVVLRLDVSYRTQVENPGDSHLVISFGTGQAF